MKKETRGRKPIKDKKQPVTLYVRESEIKKSGGKYHLISLLNEHVDWIVNNKTS